MHGLDSKAIDAICGIGERYADIEKILLFGSRAVGTYKKSSDVDLAIVGKLTQSDIWTISGWLNDESPTPYSYDVVNFDAITDEGFKEVVRSSAKVIYEITAT